MKDLYLEGEEKFGIVLSFLYYLGVKLPVFNKFYVFVVGDLRKTNAKLILDVGTGPGDIPIALGKADSSRKIYAIDPSKYVLWIAESRPHTQNVIFDFGSSRHLPWNAKFDLIYTALSYHHWAEKKKSLKYLSTFLNKGGEIRIYENNAKKIKGFGRKSLSSHAIYVDQLYKEAKSAGLRVTGKATSGQFIRLTLKKRL